MFYTFTIKIKEGKTFKNVTDTVRDSFIEREMHDIKIQGNHITGKDDLIKLDFSSRYPITISPAKEHFIYDENTRILTYKIGAFYPIFFNLIYAGVLFLILHFLVQHWIIELVVPSIFFILITIAGYAQYQMTIDKISRKINED
ncbi:MULTISPECIES: hypothetical protein [unclassified Chryseobacterium]|uniref:hypothetical protein n=1 Tax=unclassified Chryseobacterium TaxID=2593645 RepID=UPI00100B691C|nr:MULTISPECIES: hypothetical protein [unclassified Chryseobacterium]RXM50409.1 hypothetical protein BOQ64_18485 [Chryseobacterium sp. CH25]RXM64549.1 hypothetical protein BOQ60_09975 [Chryseobacterium sp. CH1]